MSKADYIVLIQKKLTGIITGEETEMLNHWLSVSGQNQEVFQHMQTIWEESEDFGADFQPDVDRAILKFKQSIKTEAIPEKTIPATSKVVSLRKKHWFSVAAAAAVVLVCGWYFWSQQNTIPPVEWVTVKAEQPNMVHQLPDGSQVWLNGDAEIKYPKTFAQDSRNVQLTGEAFFQVQKADGLKFIVETAHTDVTVLGTAFNVNANPVVSFTEVEVVEGKVSMESKDKQQQTLLTANKRVRYNHNSRLPDPVDEVDHNELTWHTGTLSFKQKSIGEVKQTLEKLFKVAITFSNPDLKKCLFTSMFSKQDVDVVLKSISTAMNWELKKSGTNSYTLSGEACK